MCWVKEETRRDFADNCEGETRDKEGFLRSVHFPDFSKDTDSCQLVYF